MSLLQKYSLKLRMQFLIGIVATAAFSVTIGYAIVTARSMERHSALARSGDIAARYAAEISGSLNGVIGSAREAATVFGALETSGIKLDQEIIRTQLQRVLEEDDTAVGAWVILNLEDGSSTTAIHSDAGKALPGVAAGVLPLADDPWVQEQLTAGKEAIAEPRRASEAKDSLAFTRMVTPVTIGGKVVGIVGVDVALSKYVGVLQEIGKELATFGTGYMSIVSNGGRYAAHPKHVERIGNTVLDTDPWSEPFLDQIKAGQQWETESLSKTLGLFSRRISRPIVIGKTGTPWTVWMTLPMDEFVMKNANAMTKRTILISLLGLAVLGLVVHFVSTGLVAPLRRAARGLGDGAKQVRQTAEQMKDTSDDLARGASEQAADIEETSASLEELSAMTARNAENARQADDYMAQTKTVVESGNKVVEQLINSMREISATSAETKKIVKTIDEIAFQTNILALNAAVEAARAGEAGAGFAVVADEVRSLAQRAAEASRNTSTLIDNSIRSINEGEHLVTSTYENFTNISETASKAAELVGEIRESSHQGDKGIAQINTAVSQVDQLTQSNAENSNVAASAATRMFEQAEEINQYVADLAQLINGTGKGRTAPGKESMGDIPTSGTQVSSQIGQNGFGKSPKHRLLKPNNARPAAKGILNS